MNCYCPHKLEWGEEKGAGWTGSGEGRLSEGKKIKNPERRKNGRRKYGKGLIEKLKEINECTKEGERKNKSKEHNYESNNHIE